jgi:hypothetical protein
MIKTGLIGVNDYSLPAPAGKMAEKYRLTKGE